MNKDCYEYYIAWLSTLITETKAKFVISNVPQTYKEAVQTCEINHNGQLVGEEDFDTILPQLSLYSNYWTNSYTTLSDWINYEGLCVFQSQKDLVVFG